MVLLDVMDVPSSSSDSAFHSPFVHQYLFHHIAQYAAQGKALARAHFHGGQAPSCVTG